MDRASRSALVIAFGVCSPRSRRAASLALLGAVSAAPRPVPTFAVVRIVAAFLVTTVVFCPAHHRCHPHSRLEYERAQ
jgi:hypothetical protein